MRLLSNRWWGQRRTLCFYLHGNGDTLLSAETIAEPFIRRGYDAFLLDYRGYGKSTGAITSEAALHRDVLGAYHPLRKTYRDNQIIIYGFSLGTGLAVRLAAATAPLCLRASAIQTRPFLKGAPGGPSPYPARRESAPSTLR